MQAFSSGARTLCSRKRHVESPKERRKWLPEGLLFSLSLIFLRHKIKDGGYNNTNINNQLLPAQNTPALQAIYDMTNYENSFGKS